jgi:signal peptidase I
MNGLLDALVTTTERFITWRRVRKHRKKERQKKKNPVLDWIEAFLWAAGVVLLINQYLLQAYQIPSGSMTDTLLVNDRIFVNKLTIGPELLPGIAKLPGLEQPRRGEVIIFENPSYISRGPVFDVLQRVLYMLTLSFVDIDRDEQGNPKAHFLIKRAVGYGGDRLRFRDGNMEIRPAGVEKWIGEKDFQGISGLRYPVRRLVTTADYALIREAARSTALLDMRLVSADNQAAVMKKLQGLEYVDGFAFDLARSRFLYAMAPHERRVGARWRSHEEGLYLPPGRILPLGDNRDNSRDGRFFGHIPTDKVLGKAMFIYWPINRFGLIR